MELHKVAKRALGLIDLTNLNDDCTDADVAALCERAQTAHGSTAAVCVWPRFVKMAKMALEDTGIAVATVVNFPGGGNDVKAVMKETKSTIGDEADEVDLVMPYEAFKSGDLETVSHMISTIRAVTHNRALLKVILETGELADQELVARAAALALEEGADFIKTSTGKVAENATLQSAETMLNAIKSFGDRSKGFKPAGGIKSVEDCAQYLALADTIMGADWANAKTFRFGASGVLDDVLAAIEGGRATPDEGY